MELDRCCTRVVSGSRGGVVIAAAVVVEDLIITIIAEVIMSKGMVDKNNADASGHDQVLLLQTTLWFCWLFACQGCERIQDGVLRR